MEREERLSINDVCRLPILRRPDGSHPDSSTVSRWINQGVHGTRLTAIRVGGRLYVTVAAVSAFLRALNDDEESPTGTTGPKAQGGRGSPRT